MVAMNFVGASLGPRPKTNPSTDRFQYRARGVFPRVILQVIHAPDEVWGRVQWPKRVGPRPRVAASWPREAASWPREARSSLAAFHKIN